MSNIVIFERVKSLVMSQAEKFLKLASSHRAVNFEQEASFALQVIRGSDFLARIADSNADSLINAVHNIASIGLSLNPALKHAYLVPRDGKVCLDIAYKGLVHLAIESGSLKFVQAELVYEKDKFILKGRGQEPIHERNPFSSDRGALIGAYCVAKTSDNEFLVETMTAKQILEIRDRTQAYKSYKDGKAKTCPWVSDEGEMFKKTVIRRASKSWPMSNKDGGRVAKAMEVNDEADPIIDVTPVVETTPSFNKEESLNTIRDILSKLYRDEATYVKYLTRINQREIKELNDLAQHEIENALIQLNELLAKKELENATSEQN